MNFGRESPIAYVSDTWSKCFHSAARSAWMLDLRKHVPQLLLRLFDGNRTFRTEKCCPPLITLSDEVCQ